VIVNRWAELHKIPATGVGVPSSLGGLGIGPWDGVSTITPSIPSVPKSGLILTPATTWRAERIMRESSEMNIPITSEAAAAFASEQLGAVMASDDVPLVAQECRRTWKRDVARTHFRVTALSSRVPKPIWTGWAAQVPQSAEPATFNSEVDTIKMKTILYGRFSFAVARVKVASKLLQYSSEKMSLSSWMEKNEPELWREVRRMRARAHMSEVLDFLGGNISLPTTLINPDIKDVFTRCVLTACGSRPTRGESVRRFFSVRGKALERQFCSNELIRYAYARI